MDNSNYNPEVFNEFVEVVKSHIKDKIDAMPAPVFARLMYEMKVFKHGGCSDLLHAYRRVESIRKAGYHVGPGRNAMACSLVHFFIGLTEIDPIRYGLYFERFYNPILQEKGRKPTYEFDTDMPSELLGEIILKERSKYDYEELIFYHPDMLARLNQIIPKGFSIPENDPGTLSLFSKGDTEDIFLFGNLQMRGYLQELQPSGMEDLSALYALSRPESDHLIRPFIDAKNKGFRRTGDKVYDEILEPTYGVIVYQEQLLSIFHKVFGLNRSESEMLRRKIRKNEPVEKKYRQWITDDIRKACKTAFLKAHSISYTTIAYRLAYGKMHYPELWK